LNGTVTGFLDPLFDAANADLTSVRYEDVIVAEGGINGDFTSVALIANSSLFEMNSDVDGNTIDVTVARTSLGDISDVPGVIVSLGGPFDAMVSDRSNGVGSSSCGLASASGGSCLNRFAQNDATQVMTDASPEDPFDWLRTGVRAVGELAVWGRGIGAWGESDGWAGSKGSKFDLAGAIVGVDYVFDRDLMAGVAAQWTTTNVDFKGRPDNADVNNFEFGAYASLGDARLYLNANASAIWHNVRVHRFTNGGGQALGDYAGTTLSVFAEAGKIFETDEGLRIGPFMALSLTHLETDPYREKGTGPLLFVRGAELDSLKSAIGARFGYPIELESGRKVVPELRLAWGHEFMDNQASFNASVIGQNGAPSIILGEKFARDTLQVGTGVTVPVSDSTNIYVDYDAGLNPDITTHTVSLGFRTRW
jgi:outer membrane autotransporter protein